MTTTGTFEAFLQSRRCLLAEGAVIERLRRDPAVELHPHMLHAPLVGTTAGQRVLSAIYGEYMDIARAAGLPIIMCTPTWRANAERVALSTTGPVMHHAVNEECVRFLQRLRDARSDHEEPIFIGGLVGCKGDAYNPAEALGIEEATTFHAFQLRALAEAGVDFVVAETLPAVSEAIGIVKAAAPLNVPTVVSFIITSTGTLLDGTMLFDAVQAIDESVPRRPLGYGLNCIHPCIALRAMNVLKRHQPRKYAKLHERLMYFKGNASPLSPDVLNNLPRVHATSIDVFASDLAALLERVPFKVVGGCCGTTGEHVQAIARVVATFFKHRAHKSS